MRWAVTILFLGLYGLALVRPAFRLVEYYVKLEEYKLNCINKAKPELHCDGKCILMQRIKAMNDEMQEPIAPSPVKINFEDYPIAVVELSPVNKTIDNNTNKSQQLFSPIFYSHNFLADIFHPPSTVC